MEEKILEIFKIANELNERQEKVYVQITYEANNMKTFEIAIRSKQDFTYIDKCEMQLKGNYKMKCNNIIKLIESYF